MKNTHAENSNQANSYLPKPMMVLVISALMTSPAFLAGCSSTQSKPNEPTISYHQVEQEQNLPMITDGMDANSLTTDEEVVTLEDSETTSETNTLAEMETSAPEEASVLEEIDEVLESIPAITYQQPEKKTFHFEFDQQGLSATDLILIREHALFLSEHPSKKVQIHGHADAQGPAEYNQYLSQQRAKHVAEIFKEEGIGEERIEIISWGSDKPLAEGKHWKDHRRVELQYSDEVLVEATELQEEIINTIN